MDTDETPCPTHSSEKNTSDFNINRKIFVGNISYRVRSRKLKKFFSKFGEVENSYIVKEHIKKWSRGIGFITFKTEESMKKTLQASADELVFDGRQMRVNPAELSSKTTYWQNSAESSDDDDDGDGTNNGDNRVLDELKPSGINRQSNDTVESCVAMDSEAFDSTAVNIDDLFDEILIRIFSLLSVKEKIQIERVCKRWQHLAKRSWVCQRELHFQNMFKRFASLTDKILDSILKRCGQYVKFLDLSGSPRILTDFAMDIIAKQCPDLLGLDITLVNVTDISLRNLVSRCTKLQRAKLKKCLHITDQGINNLLSGSPDMEHLDLADLHTISGQCFQCVGEKLSTLILDNCSNMRVSSIEILAKRCKQLKELHLSYCRLLDSVAVRCICQNFTHLKTLDFTGSGNLVDSKALEDLGKLENLEFLNLALVSVTNDPVIVAVAHGCKILRHLSIMSCDNVTDIGFSTLRQLTQLESLDISYLRQISKEAFINLAQEGRLKKVVARATKLISDEVVITLAALCPYLYHIDLCGCYCITNEIFEGFKNNPENELTHTIELYLGGTSVDWLGSDVNWLSGISRLQVYMHNLTLKDLQIDRDSILVLPDMQAYSDDEEYEPHLPLEDFQPGPSDDFDYDWEEENYGGDHDDYLDNDDPLAAERWDMT